MKEITKERQEELKRMFESREKKPVKQATKEELIAFLKKGGASNNG